MVLPQSAELNELNRVLIAVTRLCDQNRSCSVDSVITLCSSVTLGGHPVDHEKTLRLCTYAGFLTRQKGMVTLTEVGQEFMGHNPDLIYEITDAQKHFFAERVILRGPWRPRARDLLLSFSPNFPNLTYELGIVDNPPPVRYNSLIHLLQVLGVLAKSEGKLSVAPVYVATVNQLRADQHGTTEGALDQMLQASRKLGALAEDAVVEYERKRLRALGRDAEAELVRRISQLNAGAGYDVESFNGDKPLFDYDRFIEVKASQESDLRFFWTSNERRVAENKGAMYWIYFVGEFRKNKADQITPVMIQNPASRLSQISQIGVETATYLVRQRDDLPLQPAHQLSIGGFVL
jgi:hypothetical protein